MPSQRHLCRLNDVFPTFCLVLYCNLSSRLNERICDTKHRRLCVWKMSSAATVRPLQSKVLTAYVPTFLRLHLRISQSLLALKDSNGAGKVVARGSSSSEEEQLCSDELVLAAGCEVQVKDDEDAFNWTEVVATLKDAPTLNSSTE